MATRGTVIGVISNIVTIQVDGPVAQNEICYITTGGDRLMAEVIKVVGRNAYVQVFESTRGMKVGAEAEFTGHMLEVTLGRGGGKLPAPENHGTDSHGGDGYGEKHRSGR